MTTNLEVADWLEIEREKDRRSNPQSGEATVNQEDINPG